VRGNSPRRFCELRDALFPRAQPAHPVHHELACRAHCGKARRGARGPEPPVVDHQRAAAPSEVAPGLDAFPAWCLGHDPSAQILCVSYAQDLADKLSRDCRHIVAADW